MNTSALVALLIVVLTDEQLTPQSVFTTIALVGAVKAIAQQYAYAFIVLSRWKPSLDRIEEFLKQESLPKNELTSSTILANGGFQDKGNAQDIVSGTFYE